MLMLHMVLKKNFWMYFFPPFFLPSFLLTASPLFLHFSIPLFLSDVLFSSFFSFSSFLLFFFTFYLLVALFFLTGTGKDKGVWAAMASLQGKCEALGKIDLSFLPNIGLI